MNSPAISRDAGLDALLCTTLAEASLSRDVTHEGLDALWERARLHDVDVLMAAILSRLAKQIPATVHQQATSRFAEAELRDLLRYRELCRITASFAAEAVDVLLLKGAGLAYIVYPEPCFRPSRDIDLFIRREARDAAERALSACGYTRQREPDGELARAQRQYARADGSGINHFVDLHWRVSNTRLFADALSFDEAWSSSTAVSAIDPPARTLGGRRRTATGLYPSCCTSSGRPRPAVAVGYPSPGRRSDGRDGGGVCQPRRADADARRVRPRARTGTRPVWDEDCGRRARAAQNSRPGRTNRTLCRRSPADDRRRARGSRDHRPLARPGDSPGRAPLPVARVHARNLHSMSVRTASDRVRRPDRARCAKVVPAAPVLRCE